MLQRKGVGRPRTSVEESERVHGTYTRCTRKSIRRASAQVQLSRAIIHKVLHKSLGLFVYEVQLLQAFKSEDKPP